MPLNDQQRRDAWAEFMATAGRHGESLGGMTKADLRAALDAVDDWVGLNSASFNLALPVIARGTMTAAQKARLLKVVVNARYLHGV